MIQGTRADLDGACILLEKAGDAAPFVGAAHALRFWLRESKVAPDAKPQPKKKD